MRDKNERIASITRTNAQSTLRKHYKYRHQEARLYMACFGGILFPAGMLVYAGTATESVHWIGMVIGMIVSVPPN